MKLFTDVKIGERLAIGFGIAISLTAVNLIIGIILLGGISGNLDQIVAHNSVKIKCAHDIRSALADISAFFGGGSESGHEKDQLDAKGKIDEVAQIQERDGRAGTTRDSSGRKDSCRDPG